MIRKILRSLILFSCLLLFSSQPSWAKTDFTTQTQTTYRVGVDGKTSVTKNFTITNLTPTTYVTHYALQLNNYKLDNVTGTNEGQTIDPHLVKTDELTTISLTFPNQVVGEGKTRNFSIHYDSPVFASLNGSVLEVNIPGQEAKEGETNIINVEIPKKFGQPYRSQPPSDEQSFVDGFIRFTYKNNSGQSILLIFGEQQSYLVHLRYELTNDTAKEQITEIPLPPDTTYQQVLYQQLEPKPSTIKRDSDGNWLATYTLSPNYTTIVTADISTQVYLEPWTDQLKFEPTTQQLAKTEYWSLSDSQVVALTTAGKDVGSIYRSVIKTLDYTKQNINEDRKRLGAAGALDQPEDAVCQEFTDLFIALARSQAIPARRAVGYAYSSQTDIRPLSFEGDILHTWPEFFDTNTNSWRAVDPTWEDTTGGIDYFNHFDLNHLVFVYNGVSSSRPLPPGSYQQDYLLHKTISVDITDKPLDTQPQLETSLEPLVWLGIKLPIYRLKIINLTGQAWYGLNNTLVTNDQTITINWLKSTFEHFILPFGKIEHPVVFTSDRLTPQLQTVRIQVNLPQGFSYEQKQTVVVIPNLWLSAKIFWWLAAGATIIALIGGSLLVFRQSRPSALRRQSQKSQAARSKLYSTQNPTSSQTTAGNSGDQTQTPSS